MTPFNFAPLYRSTIGFDRLAHLVDSLATTGEDGGYPPYNIERVAENSYRISMAVAGFTCADVNIEVKDTTLGRWLLPGDRVTLSIERLGSLTSTIVDRPA